MKIFEPFELGGITLNNRIVMAPMTRSRAINNLPNDLMKTYYSQRAGAGLIITEGTSPSRNGLGYARIPAAYSAEQQAGWKTVAEGVHDANGRIFVQLMHTGRVTAAENLPEGGKTLAPSAVQLGGEMWTDGNGMVAHTNPEAMTEEEILATQEEYVAAAKGLIDAGVDGVELHGANGYLLEQFLNPNSNQRTDNYGGSFENRARFVLETASKVAAAVGGDKVGIRLSPYGAFNDMLSDYPDLVDLYTYLAKGLADLNLAYVHVVDQRVAMGAPEFSTDIKRTIKANFNGVVIVGGDVKTAEEAEKLLNEGYDLVYIGRPFLSNPSLVDKLKSGAELAAFDFEKAYTPGAEGYTDYA